jgi:hypothetical protein
LGNGLGEGRLEGGAVAGKVRDAEGICGAPPGVFAGKFATAAVTLLLDFIAFISLLALDAEPSSPSRVSGPMCRRTINALSGRSLK